MRPFYNCFIIALLLSGCSNSNLQINKDSDYDGVIDIYDKCDNTPFMDIVDENGCSLMKTLNKITNKQIPTIN